RGLDTGEFVHHGEPAFQAAVEYRQMPQEYQVTAKERARRLVQHRQVGVGVGRAPGFQPEYAATEIELRFAIDEPRRWDDLHVLHEIVAKTAPKRVEIELPACGQCARQIPVADKDRVREGRIAENVV